MKSVKLFEKYTLYEDGSLFSEHVDRFLSPCINGRGYLQLGLRVNGKLTNFRVHRLVAENFLDKNGFNEVNHKDGDKMNNHVSNLEWCSRSDNIQHAYDLSLRKRPIGSANGRAWISEETVHAICRHIVDGKKTTWIAKEVGVNWNNVAAIRKKRNWSVISNQYF